MDDATRQRVKGAGPVTHRVSLQNLHLEGTTPLKYNVVSLDIRETCFNSSQNSVKNNVHHGLIRVDWVYFVLSAEQLHGKRWLHFLVQYCMCQ